MSIIFFTGCLVAYRYPSEFVAGRIGIITPYKRQLAVLRSRFSSAFGSQVAADMELNTVDGFQGREVDILVLSTVRATHSASDGNSQSRIGFVADVRRMNVALTRARLSLWVFGNTRTLQRDHNWGALVKDAKEREAIIPVKRPYNMFGEKATEQKQFENLSKNFPEPEKQHQHSRRKEHRAETSSDRKMRKPDGDVVPLLSKGSESKQSRRKAKEEASSQREKLATGSEEVTSEVNPRRNQEKKEKMKGIEKSSDPEDTDVTSSKKEDPNARKKSKKASSKLDSNKREKSTDESEQRDRQANKSNAPSNQGGGEDLVSKRKKEREAVEAILKSSLIPSHKPKPPKRPLSPSSTASSHTRPSKAIKGNRFHYIPNLE